MTETENDNKIRKIVDELAALMHAVQSTIVEIQSPCEHRNQEFIKSTRNEDYEGTTFAETWVCQRCVKVIVK